MNYVEKIKSIFTEVAPSGKIRDNDEWIAFMKKICVNKLIQKEEIEKMDPKVIIYPIGFTHTLET